MGTDTIAAIATAMTSSGIGIVRISGDEAVSITDRIFEMKNQKKLEDMPTHTIHYGHIHDGDEVIDEVMVVLMREPKSYTREDTVEIDCHGGVYVMKRILETVIKYGARPAEPGEFTKRAFLNGRIDLSQAESVIDVINSKNEFALKSSLSQLSGSVSEKIKEIRGTVLHEIAFIESALDDPEHISLDGYPEKLSGIVSDVIKIPGMNGGSVVTTGFAHHAVLSHAEEIVQAVHEGAIRHFFLIGGCDGTRPSRRYYTDFAKLTPPDTVILTLACGKFRLNDLPLGTVAGLPRILDVGQCNDAYSAIRIALGLAEAFDCSVNELPLSIILCWFEQKAVCVLMALLALGIRGIRLGPTLPAFLSPGVAAVLQEKYDLRPITTPEDDLAACLGRH